MTGSYVINKDFVRWIFRAWKYRLFIEKQEIKFLLNNLKPGQTVVDIGAYKGAYTYWMSKSIGAAGKVFAFEPQPEAYTRLKKLLNQSHSNNVHLELLALSSKKGHATILRPGDKFSPSASISFEKNLGRQTLTVETTTLDNYFLKENQIPVHFIKCDVEGHELDVFRSGVKMIKKYQPTIIVECEARHCGKNNVKELFFLFEKLGYKGFFYNGELMANVDDFDIFQYQLTHYKKIYVNNFFFTPDKV